MAVRSATKGRRPASRPGQHSRTTPAPPPDKKEGELIGNLYDNMDEDTVVVVHRFDPESGRQVLMYKLMPSEATDIEIQRLSGGGKYSTREHVLNEQGSRVFGRSRIIVVAGPPRMAEMPQSYANRPTPTPKPEVGTVGDKNKTSIDDVLTAGILRLFTSQAEASETQAKMYQAMLARPDAPHVDWSVLITALIPLAVKLLDRKNDGPNMLEMVTQVAAMMKENTSSTTQFKDMLETVDTVFGIKEQVAGPVADPLTTLAGQLPKILEIISTEQSSKGRMPTEEEVKRRLASPQKPSGGNMPVHQMLLKKFAPMLVRWAQAGKDPSLMGDFLYNSIPEKLHGAVREFLLRDDAEEVVYQAAPDLRGFPQWTQDCFGTLAESFGIGEEEEEAEVSEVHPVEVGDGDEEVTVVEETVEIVEE